MKFDINEIKNMRNVYFIAPAGCGKTETITDIVGAKSESKKYLILTHTNAGVKCIHDRLIKKNIPLNQCNISTIASFCYKYVNAYPKLSKKENIDKKDYNATYIGMDNLLKNKTIQNILRASYSQILIDEYQDCTELQHNFIVSLSKIVPCKLFGDPLQGIFDFKDNLVDWNTLCNDFEYAGTFDFPWRWENHNRELGKWIMQIRKKLINSEEIFLNDLPSCVEVITDDEARSSLIHKAFELLKNKNGNLILFQYPNQAYKFSQMMKGCYFCQEEIECKSLRDIASIIKSNTILAIYEMAKLCFTKFSEELGTIYKKVKDKNYNFNRITKNKDIAELTKKALQDKNYYYNIIEKIEQNQQMKLYRKELWNEFKKVLREYKLNPNKDINEIIDEIRNNSSLSNKYKYKNLVSRVLLVKGLEFDTVVVVNPEELTKKLFYVAISRPTDKLIIVSKKLKLTFKN